MTIEEDLNAFSAWASKLGCDPDNMPNEEALKSIFKSRQRDLFTNMMSRVKPQKEVEEIRENILINRIEKIKSQSVVEQTCGRNFLPKELQKCNKIKDLKLKKANLEKLLEEHKKEYEILAASIKTKNIKHINLKQKHKTLQAKVSLLEFKSEYLDKDIEKEEKQKQQILETMPVKLTTQNANEADAMKAVKKTIQELETFYNISEANKNNPQLLAETKDELWKQIRINFANIPNYLIFNAVMRLKEEQLQHIILLNTKKIEDAHGLTHCHANNKEFSAFEIKLAKTKANLLGLVARYLEARKERNQLEETFSKAYLPFVDELQKKINLFNTESDENVENIISDYLVQFNSRNFAKSENEYIAQQIEYFKNDIENTNKHIENHEVLLGSIKQVYDEINESVNRIQYDMLQLNQIKEKILYSKNMMKHMLNDMKAPTTAWPTEKRNTLMPPQLKVNDTTLFNAESFELGAENVLCSTKLDLDFTISSLNNTTLQRSFSSADTTIMSYSGVGAGGTVVPTYLTELNTFAETPLEKFSCISKQCAFYLAANPIILESRELSSILQLAPATLCTPFGTLEEVIKRIKQSVIISKLSTDLKLNLEPIYVESNSLIQKHKEQRELIAELIDKIEVAGANTNHILQRASKLYKFVLENPLRNYIPSSKTFNNQTYSDYESEYIFYHRLSTGDTTTQ